MTSRVRILTANLLRDRVAPRDLLDVLDRHRPDVLAIQELGPETALVVADRFQNHDLEPDLAYIGRGMASDLPAEFGPLGIPWRDGVWGRIGTDEGPLTVASVHLLNPINFPWWVTAKRRDQQLDRLFDWVDRTVDGPLVVCGDMNASPAWAAYRRLAARWDDLVVGTAEASGAKPEPTWGWRPGWPRMLRIDHVFGQGVRASGSEVVPIRGSDHAGLVIDIELGSS